jgi:hypothetical protein
MPAFVDQVKVYFTKPERRSGHVAGPSGVTVVM